MTATDFITDLHLSATRDDTAVRRRVVLHYFNPQLEQREVAAFVTLPGSKEDLAAYAKGAARQIEKRTGIRVPISEIETLLTATGRK